MNFQCLVLGMMSVVRLHSVFADSDCEGATESMQNSYQVALYALLSVCNDGDPCTQLEPCSCSQIPTETSTSPMQRRRRSDIPPNNTFYTVLDCKVPRSAQALDEVVSSALNRKMINKLIVSNVQPTDGDTAARLPTGWLRNTRVRNFQILDSKMSPDFIWYDNPFEGQGKSLLTFAAHNCSLYGSLTYETSESVNTRGLSSLPLLEGLDLSHNHLTVVSADSFRYSLDNLSMVVLSHNAIQFIESGTFHHTPLLRYIDLSHNRLDSVKRNVFASPASNLEHIILSWNSLTTLSPDFFENMPNLRIVNVSNNYLHSLPEKPWEPVWRQLFYIDVRENFVECNCDLTWLLPILVTPEDDFPRPLYGQTVWGSCIKTEKWWHSTEHGLTTLTADSIDC